jgi:diacylglycerol O-acyltransferase / wax synthase
MHQLGALDNLMIEGEIPNIPLHMSAMMIYATGGKRGVTRMYDALEQRFEGLVEKHFPILRCRVEDVAMQLDKAYWVEDAQFNLAYHIKRVALPKPNNWQQVYRLLGQFHAQPLDRARPLWEVMVVEGLDSLEGIPRGSTALFVKIHHAVMDGKGALRLLTSLHSLTPEFDAPTLVESMPEQQAQQGDFNVPSFLSKYGRAWWHAIERPFDLVATLIKLLPLLLSDNDTDHTATKRATPQTPFNRHVDADRVVGHVRLDTKQLRKLVKKQHCTINDIALCVVAGALRAYLLEENALPEDDLQTLMPIDIRREGEDGSLGNHVSVARVSLYTSISDVRERLLAISADSSHSKKRSKKPAAHAMLDLVDEIHPAIILGLGQWLISSGHMEELPLSVNTVVTNVPGLSSEAYLAGAKLVDYLGFGPLAPNIGLFHTVSSTQDHVNISFLSTAAFMGDGSAYRAALEKALEEIVHLQER